MAICMSTYLAPHEAVFPLHKELMVRSPAEHFVSQHITNKSKQADKYFRQCGDFKRRQTYQQAQYSSYLCTGLFRQLFLGCLPDTLEKVALIDIWWEVLFLVPSLNVGRETSKQFFVGETG